jgi:hypothetical protein
MADVTPTPKSKPSFTKPVANGDVSAQPAAEPVKRGPGRPPADPTAPRAPTERDIVTGLLAKVDPNGEFAAMCRNVLPLIDEVDAIKKQLSERGRLMREKVKRLEDVADLLAK